MQSASTAISRSVAGASQDAAIVAGGSAVDGEQMLSALLDSKQQLLYTQAGAKMMETASQMLGTLIDISA